MNRAPAVRPSLGLHMTNVTGLGATTLMTSLLPVIEVQALLTRFHSAHLYLPPHGTALAVHGLADARITMTRIRRRLPNALSRLCECTLLGWRYLGQDALIVFGDLPICFVRRQVLFVHTAHVTGSSQAVGWSDRIKYLVSRLVFRLNQRFVLAFIVQTDVMAQRLLKTYPALAGRISVVPQPPPAWLLRDVKQGQRTGRTRSGTLQLIYPAANYPHKNHDLLYRSAAKQAWAGLAEVVVTVDRDAGPDSLPACLKLVGRLSPSELTRYYTMVDALIFPSLEESYGLPLVEAMYVGIPVVCADLPYARTLCGDTAIYFSPQDADGVPRALHELRTRLARGWWPDWRPQLDAMPGNWDEVATRIMDITCRVTASAHST